MESPRVEQAAEGWSSDANLDVGLKMVGDLKRKQTQKNRELMI